MVHVTSRLIIFLVCVRVYFNKMVSELLWSECRVREKERVKQCEKNVRLSLFKKEGRWQKLLMV